jgi:hypothetical protein
LANDIGYAKTVRNFYELNIAQGKRNAPVACGPAAVGSFRLGPPLGEGFDEAGVPETAIVTAMGDDSVSRSNRFGRVAFDVFDWHR